MKIIIGRIINRFLVVGCISFCDLSSVGFKNQYTTTFATLSAAIPDKNVLRSYSRQLSYSEIVSNIYILDYKVGSVP